MIPDHEERLASRPVATSAKAWTSAPDTLFLALTIAWKGTVVQYAGRHSRLHSQKTEVRIYDYVDRRVPMLARIFENRLRGYRVLGYGVSGDRAESTSSS